jgi:hypothetical protein
MEVWIVGKIVGRILVRNSGRAAVGIGILTIAMMCCAPAQPAVGSGERGVSNMTAKKTVKVPMKVEYKRGWLTWVASTTGCLRALGVECDNVDVAGYSGYAFLISVHDNVHVSGPTAFDWGLLLPGICGLGRSTLAFHGAHCKCDPEHGRDPNAFRRELREVYDLVAREINAGRPCVIWGPYDPDFGIAVGVQGEKYLVESWKRVVGEPQPPVPFDQLVTPSGAYVLAFPTEVKMARAEADRRAIYHALEMLSYRAGDPQYATGQAAYDRWIVALEAGKAEAYGNSFNAQCWSEARRFAHEFLSRLAARNRRVAEPLRLAATAYADVAEAIGDVATLFPFPDSRKLVEDPKRRAEAIQALRAAKAAEAKAAQALAQAAADWPPE